MKRDIIKNNQKRNICIKIIPELTKKALLIGKTVRAL